MNRTRATALAAAPVFALGLIGSAFALSGGRSASAPASPAVPSVTTGAAPGGTVPSAGPSGTTSTVPEAGDPAASEESAAGLASTVPSTVPGAPAAPPAPVHEVFPGDHGTPPPAGPGGIIGELGDDLPVPGGLVAPPPPPKANGFGGPGGLAVAPGCSHSCITSGVAHPRGFGAHLEVTTSVPATLFMSAVADLDHNGSYETAYHETTAFPVTSHAWSLDHLAPGTTYHAMVAATDVNQHTDHAWGTFTTLSKRDVFVSFGDLTVNGGPGGVTSTRWLMGFDGPPQNVTPGQQGILLFKDVERTIDLDFWVDRQWNREVCEVWEPNAQYPHGHGVCNAWNSTSVDVDLDHVPAGAEQWTSTTVGLTLQPANGAGGALPNGYGDPYWFSFSVPVTLHITYS